MNAVMLPPDQLSHELRTETTADLQRRRWIIGLSFAGALIGKVVGAYQTGMIKRLPDILPGEIFDAEKVDASNYAYENAQMPDGLQMVVNYGLTASIAGAGGTERALQNPALPVATAAKAGFDLALCLVLARKEWAENKKLCSWCQVATALSAVSFALALPEAGKALGGGATPRLRAA